MGLLLGPTLLFIIHINNLEDRKILICKMEGAMEFNPDKCDVMNFGKTNNSRTYTINGRILTSIKEQREIGAYPRSSNVKNWKPWVCG